MKILKFRPVLTAIQIGHILSLCKKDLSNDSISVISSLAPFKAKIDNNAMYPAYSIDEKPSIIESLGFENDINYMGLTPTERKQKAYDKWVINPDSCNVYELGMAQAHRLDSKLMTEDEENKFWEDMDREIEKNVRIAKECITPRDFNL